MYLFNNEQLTRCVSSENKLKSVAYCAVGEKRKGEIMCLKPRTRPDSS